MVTPDGSKLFVTNYLTNATSVVDTATNTVIGSIAVGINPQGISITPDGSKVYVANHGGNTVSVIATATTTVTATIPVGNGPFSFGNFIQPGEPPLEFAGTPGNSTCHGESVAALASKFGDVTTAAATLGFSSVQALQKAIWGFCKPTS